MSQPEGAPNQHVTHLFLSMGEAKKPTLEQQQEGARLLIAMSKQYGAGTMLAAAHKYNLYTMIDSLHDPKRCSLPEAEREESLKQCRTLADGTITLLAPLVGACCPEHMDKVLHAINEQTTRMKEENLGDAALAPTEGAAKEVLAKVAAQQ